MSKYILFSLGLILGAIAFNYVYAQVENTESFIEVKGSDSVAPSLFQKIDLQGKMSSMTVDELQLVELQQINRRLNRLEKSWSKNY